MMELALFSPWIIWRGAFPRFADMWQFPSFLEKMMDQMRAAVQIDLLHAPKAISAVRYTDRAPLERECDDFAKVLGELKPGFAETFMTAPSPGIIAAAMLNAHYATLEEYVAALADALRIEYETIVARGHVLQIDAPDLAMERHVSYAERPLKEFLGGHHYEKHQIYCESKPKRRSRPSICTER